MFVEHNISRINYLLKLFKLSKNELLNTISIGRVNPIVESEVFSTEIKLSILKKIDKIFDRGIEYYLNPLTPSISKSASIFFRKDDFKTELNIEAKKIVTQFEELNNYISAISKLSKIKIKRTLPVYSVNDDPELVAKEIRSKLYPEIFKVKQKEFLKSLISKFAENNVLVFEFVKHPAKTAEANINGFFIKPNVIVLKRQQKSFRREIFTLIHELGHYLLNEEEIEEVNVTFNSDSELSKVENWCNKFAYSFLINESNVLIDSIKSVNATNDYYHDLINEISTKTHLSVISLYTRLLYQGKLSKSNYQKIKNDLDEEYKKKLEKEQILKEQKRASGEPSFALPSKPINSPIYVNVLQSALIDGTINEYDFCKRLNIKSEKVSNYL